MACLYIVSTPIGNLGDFSHRAVEVLREADRILAEDTRRTGILCRAYEIETRLVSAHEHNEAARAEQVVAWLEAGESLALVTDAGTPVLSDPGARLVERVVEAGHRVVPIPGASALLAALVGAGLGGEPFTFFGFLPRSGRERKERLAEIEALPHTAVLYESPERLVKLLEELGTSSGERRVAVARELTKVHEEFRRGTLAEVADYYREAGVKGEVVVVVEGAAPPSAEVDAEAGAALAGALLADGGRPSVVAREVSRRLGIPRNQAYEIVQKLKGGAGES
ncbi:MAG: 16S rRNA (cytidine(1402)-2'-O)-methyltransferase [Gemmatimonadetes bacterium]|nr:16S rRNA (cytidine(1402)-2'-O)-methyltransferase [Gemmatimonadota bacterium]